MTEERKLLREARKWILPIPCDWGSSKARKHDEIIARIDALLATEPEPVEELKRQLAEAQRDAERYRWLCKNSAFKLKCNTNHGLKWCELDSIPWVGDRFENKPKNISEAIDAAIQEQKK